MRALILGSVILAASGCATYEPHLVSGGGGAYFIRRWFGSTLFYCEASAGELVCQDATSRVAAGPALAAGGR